MTVALGGGVRRDGAGERPSATADGGARAPGAAGAAGGSLGRRAGASGGALARSRRGAFARGASAVSEAVFLDQNEDGETAEIKAFRISFASGFEIMALTSKPRSLRGRRGFVIFDEAAFHDALGELLKAAIALLMWASAVNLDATAPVFGDFLEDVAGV